MRISSSLVALSLCLFSGVSVHGADTASPSPIHAGPVYTRGDEANGFPRYPDLQIQVEVPPSTSPDLLKPELFQVSADGKPPAVANRVQTLASTGYGVAVVVSIDVSGSMKGKPLNAIRAGLGKFVNDANPQDKIALQTIADEDRWEVNWEDSRDQYRAALDKLETRGSLTRLWNSLLDAVQRFPATPIARRLVVISDGHDEGSLHTEEEVIAAAIQNGVLVDAIGITRSNPVYLQNLARLATETGGQFREAKDTDELEKLAGSGIQRLKSTPVVQFRLDDLAADGKTHRFEVTWKQDGTESTAQVAAAIPSAASSTSVPSALFANLRWLLGLGLAAVLILVLLIVVIVRSGRWRPTPLAARMGVPANVPVPVSAPLPVRTPTSDVAPIVASPANFGQRPLPPRKVTIQLTEESDRPRAKTEIVQRFPAPAQGPAAWLFCEEGFAAGQKFALNETQNWIGALANNHLQIPDDPTVSGNHACLVFDHDVLGIYDYHSTNGTKVNGEPIGEQRRLLQPGDRIRIGSSTFCVQPSDPSGDQGMSS